MTAGNIPTLALSVRQPWAWLIVHGWKNIENRTWPTRVRGRVMIHAARTWTEEEWEDAEIFVAGFAPSLADRIPRPGECCLGGIVGEVTILDCVTAHSSEWFCGPYGFVLAEQQELPFQPCKGALGFFRPQL